MNHLPVLPLKIKTKMRLQLSKKDDTMKTNHKTNKFLVRKRLILERGPPPPHANQYEKTIYKALCEQTDFLVELFGEDDEKVKYMAAARKKGLRKAMKSAQAKKRGAKNESIESIDDYAAARVAYNSSYAYDEQVATEIDAYASKPGKKERAARLLRAAMLPKTEKSITQGGKRMSPGQVRYSIAPRAGRKDKPGRVRKDKRKGKNGMIYQKGKAPVPMSEEDWLPAAKKAKKSVKKKSA